MKKIKIPMLDAFFKAIAENNKLYIPVDGKNGANYKLWEQGDKLSDQTNTLRSAKDFFFPQTENLVDFKVNGQKIEIIDIREEQEDFVVFGVRACDFKSFEVLDRVFLVDPIDTYYKNRRDHGVIITLACVNPDNTCFCQAFGIDATSPCGDIRAYKTNEYLYLESLTEKGEKLLASISDLLEDGDGKEVETQIAETKEKLAKLPLSNLTPQDFTKRQLEIFNSPKWAELAQSCLGCGTCTFVCPTCQC